MYTNAVISKAILQRERENNTKQEDIHTKTLQNQKPRKLWAFLPFSLQQKANSLLSLFQSSQKHKPNLHPMFYHSLPVNPVSSLCKTIPTKTGDRVKTDKEAGNQMALGDTGGNVQTAIRSATAWRQQGSLHRYKLQNPAFTWFSHICSQMSATRGQNCLGDSAGRCASPAQTLSICGCGSVCVSDVLLGAPRWECLTLLALKSCWEKWQQTFHHGHCSSPRCLWSVLHCQRKKWEEIKFLKSSTRRGRLHQSYREKFFHDLPRFAVYKHE